MILVLLAAACAKQERFGEEAPAPAGGVRVTLECEPLDFEAEDTKSSFSSVQPTRVTDVNYYLFDSEGNFILQEYFPDASKLSVALPDYDAQYRCYFFANVGRVTVPDGTRASDMGTALHFDYGTYANYASMLGSPSGKATVAKAP